MKPIAVDDFCRLCFLSQLRFSPNGRRAAFVLTRADKAANTYRSSIWLLEDGKPRRLTAGGKERSFQFLDEETILFPGDREEKKDGSEPDLTSRFYKIRTDGGEAEEAFRFPIPVSQLLPLPDGRFLVRGQTLPGFEDLYTGEKKRIAAWKKSVKENADYEVITQSPWWWNGTTFTKGAYQSLFLYDPSRRKLTRLSGLNEEIGSLELSPKKDAVYFQRHPVKPFMDLEAGGELCRLDLAAGRTETLFRDREDFRIEGMAAGESFLLLLASDGKYGLNTDCDFYRMDYADGRIRPYAVHSESIGSSVGSDIRYGGGFSLRMDGDTAYFISTRFDDARLFKLEAGKISPVITEPGSVDFFDVRDGKLLYAALHHMKAQEIYNEKGKQLTRFNEAPLKDRYVAQPEVLNYTRDGCEIHGFVLKPMDYDPAKKYPVILDIHGGPKTVYGPVFYHEMQYWAGKGYFVIFCNPTGSDGRGAFMDIRGRYGTVDYDDIMGFCDATLAAYPAMDAANFFETGGSYGGFMTNWIVGHTDRFKACASQRSISDWFSFYGVSDIGSRFVDDQNAADPWSDPAAVWEKSPMKYADKAVTPTLFIHSFEDYRCPIDQGYQMFTALAAHGVETRMVCFRGENHELSRSGRPLHRLRRLHEITEWFEKHRG